jgi:hypothetical protein
VTPRLRGEIARHQSPARSHTTNKQTAHPGPNYGIDSRPAEPRRTERHLGAIANVVLIYMLVNMAEIRRKVLAAIRSLQ